MCLYVCMYIEYARYLLQFKDSALISDHRCLYLQKNAQHCLCRF